MRFCGGRGHIPGDAEIEGERRRDPPIVFAKGTVDLPAAAGHRAIVCLIVNGPAGEAEQKIGLRIAGKGEPGFADKPEAILEGLCAHIHLIGAKVDAHLKS